MMQQQQQQQQAMAQQFAQPQQYAGQALQGQPLPPAGEQATEGAAAPPVEQAEGGMAWEGTCATPCTEQFQKDSSEISGITDPIELSQALCTSMKNLFSCQCDRCEAPYSAAVALQGQLCALDTAVSLHQAGGSCQGFASNFCQTPFSAEFCVRRTWVDPAGSPGWMNNGHEIMDPGLEAMKAGTDLFTYNKPAYAQSIASNLVRYLTSGAASEASKAHLKNVIAQEIEGFKPVKKEENLIETLLPFTAPAPSHREKKILEEDAKLQTEDFGRPLDVAEAHKFGEEVKGVESKMDKAGVELPPDEEKELDELSMAAEKYNSAPALSPAVSTPILLLCSSLLLALLSA